MFSHFVNKFKKDDPDERRSFQLRVHGRASRLYPDRIFTLSDDPTTLESEGIVYGLTNLHAKFLLTEQSDGELEDLVGDTLRRMSEISNADRDIPWEEAQGYLMPQLMPEAFIQMATVDLVCQPFVEGVSLGFVIDAEASYHYVNVEMLDMWGVDNQTLNKRALENLHQRSQGIEMMAFPGDNAFFIINTRDGFDAVRLLSPAMREVIAEHIGSPFFAGVPNRDFLICWSSKGDAEFQNNMRQQVSSDFDEQAYPLSRRALVVSDNGEIAFGPASQHDERAAAAELN